MPTLLSKYGYYAGSIVHLLIGFKETFKILRIFLREDQQTKICLRGREICFLVRGKMDVWSIKETFIDRFYERYGCRIGDGWTVIDIGAGIGEFTIFASAGHPGNRVVAFEPFAESFRLMHKNIALNGVDGVVSVEKAVWYQSGSLGLDLTGREPLQLTSSEMDTVTGDRPVQRVESISLDDAFKHYQINKVDLLKLDCEGAEYPILFSASPETLAQIQRIVMEYHDLEPPQHHIQLAEYLRACGYSIQVTPNRVHSHLGYLYAARA